MSETVTYYFFDTSALVKRYHDEVGTAAVDEAFDDEDAFCLISDSRSSNATPPLRSRQTRHATLPGRCWYRRQTLEMSTCSVGSHGSNTGNDLQIHNAP